MNCVQNSTFKDNEIMTMKILYLTIITSQCIHGLAPSYLGDLIVKKPSLWLRSDKST